MSLNVFVSVDKMVKWPAENDIYPQIEKNTWKISLVI